MTGFQKAQKSRAWLLCWLNGMSSSGKTYSALLIAKGMGGKTAMIDTESGRGELYADKFDYDVMQIHAPFTPEKYIAAMREAIKAGYDNLIIDSISHEWLGVLDIKGNLDQKGGNTFTNWHQPSRRHNNFIDELVRLPCHKIVTSRVKRDWVLAENNKGKMAPTLMGLANVQREGFEYESTVEFRIDKNHNATAIKDNTGIWLDQDSFQISEETGKDLMKWLNSGKEIKDVLGDCQRCMLKDKKVITATKKAKNGKIYCDGCYGAYVEHEKGKEK